MNHEEVPGNITNFTAKTVTVWNNGVDMGYARSIQQWFRQWSNGRSVLRRDCVGSVITLDTGKQYKVWSFVFDVKSTKQAWLSVNGDTFDPVDPSPHKMPLRCPKCSEWHVDKGEWEKRPHRTHLCEYCQHQWRPLPYITVGVMPSNLEQFDENN